MKAYLRELIAPAQNNLYFDHLNQNLQQSGWTGATLTAANWRTVVREKIRPLKWTLVLEDVGSFIIDADGLKDFNKNRLLTLID